LLLDRPRIAVSLHSPLRDLGRGKPLGDVGGRPGEEPQDQQQQEEGDQTQEKATVSTISAGAEQQEQQEPEQEQEGEDKEVEESPSSSEALPNRQPSTWPSQGFSAILESLALASEQLCSPRSQSLSQTCSPEQDLQHGQDESCLSDSLRATHTSGLRAEGGLYINTTDITFVKVNARKDTPEGRKYLVTGEICLPPEACSDASCFATFAKRTTLSCCGQVVWRP